MAVTASQSSSTTTSATISLSGAYRYEIYVNGSYRGQTTGSSYSIGSMSAGSSASVGVAGFSSSGAEVGGVNLTVYAKYNTPSASTNSTTTSISVTLSGASGSDYWMELDGVEVWSSSKTFTGLSPGTSYTLYYRAYGRSSSFQDSSIGSKSVSTQNIPKLSTPTISSTSPTRKSVFVDWNTILNAEDYLLQVRSGTTVISSNYFSSSQGTLYELSPGTSYTVRVRANGDGVNYYNSDWSSSVSFTTLSIPAPPTLYTPTFNQSTGELTLSWSSVSGATGYRVEWGAAPNYTSSRTVTPGSSTSTVIAGLQRGVMYAFRVAHYSSEWSYTESGWDSITYELPSMGKLDPPTNLVSTGTSYTNAYLSWTRITDPPDSFVDYYIYARHNGNLLSGYPIYRTNKASGLPVGATVEISMQSVDSYGNYDSSDFVYITVTTDPYPNPPQITAVTEVTSEGVRGILVDWSDISFSTGYYLQWKRLEDTSWNTDFIAPPQTGSTPSRHTLFPIPGSVYQFRVAAEVDEISSGWITAYSSIVEFDFGIRPSNFSWDTAKVSGQPFNLTASEWNAFTTRINDFREYKGLAFYSFTFVFKDDIFTAAIFNQAAQAIRDCSPPTAPPSNVSSGSPIYASLLNALVNSLNSIQ